MNITKNGDTLKVSGREVSGYLVQFGNETERDLDGQFFTRRTFYGYAAELPVFYHHGFNREVRKTFVGKVAVTKDDKGIYVRGTLDPDVLKDFFDDEVEKARQYTAMIQELGLKSFLGWSSGTAAHTLRVAETGEIRQWILCEASLTPTPADWRNNATFKSIITNHIGKLHEAEIPPETDNGGEADGENRDSLKKLYAMSKDLYDEFTRFITQNEPEQQPAPTDDEVAPEGKFSKFITYLRGK